MSQETEIITFLANGVRTIKFNRPAKKNALSYGMCRTFIRILNMDANNDGVVVTIITGVGDYFSSGIDLYDLLIQSKQTAKTMQAGKYLELIEAFIQYPKLIIAVVNGPTIGIATSVLGLCDVVYASDRATFSTPFLKINLPPEGCTSYTYPRFLGKSNAMEMLILGKKLSADEALKTKLISEVIPHALLEDKIKQLMQYGKLNVNSVKRIKKLINNNWKRALLEANRAEYKLMKESVLKSFSEKVLQKTLKEKKSKL